MPRPSGRGRSDLGRDRRRSRDKQPFVGDRSRVAEAAAAGRLIVGLQPVREALRAHGNRVLALFFAETGGSDPGRVQALARFAKDRGVAKVEPVPQSELDRASGGSLHQNVAAVAPPLSFVDPQSLLLEPSLLAIALDGIQDPQNFGAVVRSAVGIADAAVVWPEHGSAPLSLATFRASAGAIEHARLCRVPSLSTFLDAAASSGALVVGLDAHAERALSDVPLIGPTVLVIGSEHTGMRRSTRRSCRMVARLLDSSAIDSLNASAAAAVALYETARQRVLSND